MPQNFHSADQHSNGMPLPLFRAEALAAQQQKFHGEIILIRPFSLMFLTWFSLGITAAVLGFLLLGQYTERAHVSGIIAAAPASASSTENLQASLLVAGRLMGRLHPGNQLTLRCESCTAPFPQQTGTILSVSAAPLDAAELSQAGLSLSGPDHKNPVYKIKVLLPPQAARIFQLNPSPQAETKVEAEIPLGRKPLIKWFFERSAS